MDYKATLNLPKTAFPMKASLPQTEPQMLAWWEQIGIYKRLREVSADRPLWILHDGPPYANGNIHMGHALNKVLKPVHWCMYCKTALAQAEVEYEDQRTPSVYVKFRVVGAVPSLPAGAAPVSLVIWTTTPWTLPANLAVAVHPEEDYVALEAGGETLVVAAKLAEAFTEVARLTGARRVATFPGRRLEGLEYRHAWIARTGKVAAAPFVAMDTGTGLVHIAPGHGEEDYELGRALGLKLYNTVDDDGRFVAEVEHFAGLTVWDANPKIVAHFQKVGALVAEHPLTHPYPPCWPCKNRALFAAPGQWFTPPARP